MPNQELLSYIKKQLDKNISKDVVRQALLKAGWPIIDIESAFSELDKRTAQPPIQKPQTTPMTGAQKELQEMVRANPDYYHIEKKPAANFQPSVQPKPAFVPPVGKSSEVKPAQPLQQEVKSVEKVFNHGIAKAEDPKATLKVEPVAIKKTDLPRSANAIKGIMLAIVAFVISAISAYVYIYWQDIKDPMFLIPLNNDAVVVINTDTKSDQWTKARQLISRIPYGEKFINELATKGILDGSVKQMIGFFNIDTAKGGLLIEFSNEIDKTKIQSLKDLLNSSLSSKEETEKYQGSDIIKVSRDISDQYSGLAETDTQISPKFILAYAQIGNKIVVSNDIDQVKAVISNNKRANIFSAFSKGLAKGIKDGQAFKKLKTNIPKEYLMWGYANIDFRNIDPGVLGKNLNGLSYDQSFFAALDQAKTDNSSGVLSYVIATDQGFTSKQYTTGELAGIMENFDAQKTLMGNTSAKIGDKDLFFYGESNNIAKYFQKIKKAQDASKLTQLNFVFDVLKNESGLDIQKIIDYMDGQSAFALYYSNNNLDFNQLGFLGTLKMKSSQIADLQKMFDGVQIKDIAKESIMRANDEVLKSYMSQVATQFESYKSQKGFYPYYLGSSPQIKELSESIKEYTPDQSAIVFNSSGAKFCAYTKLNAEDSYHCVDSSGGNGNFTFTQVSEKCNKGIYQCPIIDEGKQNDYLVDSKSFADIGVGDIKALPIFADMYLGYLINGDEANILLGTKEDMIAYSNADGSKVGDLNEIKEAIGNNRNMQSIVIVKPDILLRSIPVRILPILEESRSDMSQIFPLVSGISYQDVKNKTTINDSRFIIRDIGVEKVKAIEKAIQEGQYASEHAMEFNITATTTNQDSIQENFEINPEIPEDYNPYQEDLSY